MSFSQNSKNEILNQNLEKKLSFNPFFYGLYLSCGNLKNNNICFFTDLDNLYLLIKKLLKYAKEYVRYKMGADASDNIARTKYLCEHGYDGIIHIKSSFCTPEIGAMPIISKICNEYNMPLLFFSFDANTSEVGIKTRLEAFYDMLKIKKG